MPQVKRPVSSRGAPAAGAFPTAVPFLPPRVSLPGLRMAAAGCRGCDLYLRATQTVFGDGPRGALVMFVGEQPGDVEDQQGRPFVGPAGKLLDQMLEQVGISRDEVYVTNAVKHFKWEPRGTRRKHSKPSARQVQACHPWLEAELKVVKPRAVVALGATAISALLGPKVKVMQDRGRVFQNDWSEWIMPTVHPSSLLRIPDQSERRRARALFLKDLKKVARRIAEVGRTKA